MLAPVSYLRSLVVRAVPEDLIVDEFFSTVPSKNFDMCIISTRTKTHLPFRNPNRRLLDRHLWIHTEVNFKSTLS